MIGLKKSEPPWPCTVNQNGSKWSKMLGSQSCRCSVPHQDQNGLVLWQLLRKMAVDRVPFETPSFQRGPLPIHSSGIKNRAELSNAWRPRRSKGNGNLIIQLLQDLIPNYLHGRKQRNRNSKHSLGMVADSMYVTTVRTKKQVN